jgi:hypothetical protein
MYLFKIFSTTGEQIAAYRGDRSVDHSNSDIVDIEIFNDEKCVANISGDVIIIKEKI